MNSNEKCKLHIYINYSIWIFLDHGWNECGTCIEMMLFAIILLFLFFSFFLFVSIFTSFSFTCPFWKWFVLFIYAFGTKYVAYIISYSIWNGFGTQSNRFELHAREQQNVLCRWTLYLSQCFSKCCVQTYMHMHMHVRVELLMVETKQKHIAAKINRLIERFSSWIKWNCMIHIATHITYYTYVVYVCLLI